MIHDAKKKKKIFFNSSSSSYLSGQQELNILQRYLTASLRGLLFPMELSAPIWWLLLTPKFIGMEGCSFPWKTEVALYNRGQQTRLWGLQTSHCLFCCSSGTENGYSIFKQFTERKRRKIFQDMKMICNSNFIVH